jgi:hypothetical protein
MDFTGVRNLWLLIVEKLQNGWEARWEARWEEMKLFQIYSD